MHYRIFQFPAFFTTSQFSFRETSIFRCNLVYIGFHYYYFMMEYEMEMKLHFWLGYRRVKHPDNLTPLLQQVYFEPWKLTLSICCWWTWRPSSSVFLMLLISYEHWEISLFFLSWCSSLGQIIMMATLIIVGSLT